jgi:hypothetical protein
VHGPPPEEQPVTTNTAATIRNASARRSDFVPVEDRENPRESPQRFQGRVSPGPQPCFRRPGAEGVFVPRALHVSGPGRSCARLSPFLFSLLLCPILPFSP